MESEDKDGGRERTVCDFQKREAILAHTRRDLSPASSY